ncbi:MAG: hypothetical protein WCK90_01035 [archaeon]
MQVNLLKSIVSSIVGGATSKIVDLMYGKRNVNEFLIAKKLGLTINQTRNVLYKLGDEGLVSFVRKKDRRKGGWYTYFWTINTGKSLTKFRDKMAGNVHGLEGQIQSKKTRRFYYCPNCNIELSEDNALLNEYTCQECGEILQLKDQSAEILELEKEVARLNKLLSELNLDIADIDKKETQVRMRKMRAEDKKKKEERDARRKKMMKERAKLAKISGKGKIKPVKSAKVKKTNKKK